MLPTPLTTAFKNLLRSGVLYQNTDSKIVFICGGGDSESKPSARQKILRYAQKQFPEFNFFRAEDTFSAIKLPETDDLLTAEIRLLQYSDCILIVLESPGAIAELGAFSIDDVVASKILLINEESFRNETSFLQKGPVAKIERISEFKPVIYVKLDSILHCTSEIRTRLERIQQKKRSRTILGTEIHKLKSDDHLRMFILLDLISIYSPLHTKELKILARDVFKNDTSDLDLGVLKGLGYITTENGFLIRKEKKPQYFFSLYNIKLDHLRSKVLLHYFRKEPKRIQLIKKHCDGN